MGRIAHTGLTSNNNIYDNIVDQLTQKLSSGEINHMNKDDNFFKGISNRAEKDIDGVVDVIGHGDRYHMQVDLGNGRAVDLKAKTFAKLLKQSGQLDKAKGVKLYSCNVGENPRGFAQSLANRLGIKVIAPNNYVWTDAKGNHFVAAKDPKNPNKPDYNKRGKFITYYPKRGGKRK